MKNGLYLLTYQEPDTVKFRLNNFKSRFEQDFILEILPESDFKYSRTELKQIWTRNLKEQCKDMTFSIMHATLFFFQNLC